MNAGAGRDGASSPPAERGPHLEALTIAMAVVPGLFSRNKHFAAYQDPEVRRARARSLLLRAVVRQLAGSHGDVTGVTLDRDGGHAHLRYRVASVHLERRVTLSPAELACVAYLAGRAGSKALHPTDDDRRLVDAALRRLAVGLHLVAVESGVGDLGLS